MKKLYMNPVAEMLKAEMNDILTGSLTSSGNGGVIEIDFDKI